MSNHFHMVLETPNANLVEGMRWLFSASASRAIGMHWMEVGVVKLQ